MVPIWRPKPDLRLSVSDIMEKNKKKHKFYELIYSFVSSLLYKEALQCTVAFLRTLKNTYITNIVSK